MPQFALCISPVFRGNVPPENRDAVCGVAIESRLKLA